MKSGFKTACGVISVALSMVFVLSGCAQDGKNNALSPDDVIRVTGETPDLIPQSQQYTDSILLGNGVTAYTIVIPQTAGEHINFAVSELQDRFEESAGTQLPVASETTSTSPESGKYLYLGAVECLPTDTDISEAALGVSGYILKTVGDDVYIAGATEKGTLNGVYDFLKRTLNYRYYRPDAWQINDCSVGTYYLPAFDDLVKPDIEMPSLRTDALQDSVATGRRYRIYNPTEIFIPINGTNYHVALGYLPTSTWLDIHPEWYATDGNEATPGDVLRDDYNNVAQICYNAHGDGASYELMLTEMFDVLKRSILANQTDPSQLMYAWFTQMDNYIWCGCNACKADEEKYGSPAASIIKTAKRLATMLEEWIEEEGVGRRVSLAIYAYMNTFDAPTTFDEEVKLPENIALYYAPIRASFVSDLKDEFNSTYYENLKNWCELLGEGDLLFWAYNGSYFNDYLVPHYGFDAFQKNYEILTTEFTVKMFFGQNDYENMAIPDWGFLKNFLNAELMWDCSQDVEKLMDDYFNVVYREAAVSMRKYFNSYCDWYNYAAEVNSFEGEWTITGSQTINSVFFPLGVLQEWLGLINEAYSAIAVYEQTDLATYERLYDAICLESISPRYLLTEIHSGSYSEDDFAAMQEALNNDITRLGITALGEGGGRW